MRVGQIYRDDEFYCDSRTGEFLPKYFLVLAFDSGGDVIARLLTSRQHGRPVDPACYHGLPYPGFYLGPVCDELSQPTWLDLRALEDFDRAKLDARRRKGLVHLVHELNAQTLRLVLECCAGADDTTVRQERFIRDELANRPI